MKPEESINVTKKIYKMNHNPEQGISILDFPYYYVFKVEDSYEIWLLVPERGPEKPEIERMIVPNAEGRIAMKHKSGTPMPMYWKEVVDAVVELENKPKYVKKSRDQRKRELESKLNPDLIKQRDILKFELREIMIKAKASLGLTELRKWEEPYNAKKRKLEEFYEDNPDYDDRKDVFKRQVFSQEEKIEIAKLESELVELGSELSRLDVEIGKKLREYSKTWNRDYEKDSKGN